MPAIWDMRRLGSPTVEPAYQPAPVNLHWCPTHQVTVLLNLHAGMPAHISQKTSLIQLTFHHPTFCIKKKTLEDNQMLKKSTPKCVWNYLIVAQFHHKYTYLCKQAKADCSHGWVAPGWVQCNKQVTTCRIGEWLLQQRPQICKLWCSEKDQI